MMFLRPKLLQPDTKEGSFSTKPYTPTHLKAFNLLNYIINSVYHPLIVSGLLILLYVYIQTTQLKEIHHLKLLLMDFNLNDYKYDLLSNLANLLFILRFSLSIKFPVVFEVLLFASQVLILFTFTYSYFITSNTLAYGWCCYITTILYYCQVICPIILTGVNIIELFQSHISLSRLFINCNNNYLPVILTNSFHSINLNFPLFDLDYVLSSYKILIISLKFYCLYQYILFELINNFNNEYVDFKIPTNRNNYYVILALVVISGIDIYFISL